MSCNIRVLPKLLKKKVIQFGKGLEMVHIPVLYLPVLSTVLLTETSLLENIHHKFL